MHNEWNDFCPSDHCKEEFLWPWTEWNSMKIDGFCTARWDGEKRVHGQFDSVNIPDRK